MPFFNPIQHGAHGSELGLSDQPALQAEGLSLVWFGVLVVKLLEIGMITPPVGMNVFVIKNVAQKYVTTGQIFAGVVPFLLADLVVVVLIIAAPTVVLFLPQLL